MLFYSPNNVIDLTLTMIERDYIAKDEYDICVSDLISKIQFLFSEALEEQLQYSNEAAYLEQGVVYYYIVDKNGYVFCTLYMMLTHPEDLDFKLCTQTLNHEFYKIDKEIN